MVDSVVGSVRSPASCETVDNRSEGENGTELRSTNAHWDVHESTRVSEYAKNDHENNEGRYPTPEFVGVNNLVAKKADEEGANRDDEDASVSRDVIVDGVDQLSAHYAIDSGPSNAGENVEDSNELYAIPAEPES